MSARSPHRAPWAAILTLLLALVAVGCSSSGAATDSGGPTSTTAGSTSTSEGADAASQPEDDTPDLSGVTLRVGDQADEHLRRILEHSGEIEGIDYEIEWSTFQNGPQLIAAATGGSIDLGKLSETPLVFAQAAGSPVKVIYAARPIDPDTSSLAIAVPVGSALTSVADLEGKRVAFAKGTVLEYLLANALDQAGLTLDDIEPVALGQGIDPLASGDADAAVTGDPNLSNQLAAGAVKILATGADYTPGYYYLIARDGALDDPLVEAATADLLERIARAQEWWNDNADVAAEILGAAIGYEVDVAAEIIGRSPVAYGPIDDELVATHQAEVDFFVAAGVIEAIDATELFDLRFGG